MSEKRRLSFRRDAAARETLLAWHAGLARTDLGGRAQLRRAASPAEVVFVPAYHRLLRALEERGLDVAAPGTRKRLAAVAGLAARVDANVPAEHGVAAQLGQPAPGAKRPPVSRLRFARLVAAQELDELYGLLARALPLVDKKADLVHLADSVLFWGAETRRRWAYDYYRVAPERGAATT